MAAAEGAADVASGDGAATGRAAAGLVP